jgi:MFS family permease
LRIRRPRYFYGWNIVGASFLAHLSYAEHFSGTLGLFVKPLQEEFGWSRTGIGAVQTIGRLVEAVVAPLIGPVVDRYGPRLLMPLGALIVGSAMLAVTQATNLWQFYLFRGLVLAIGFTLMGNLVLNVAINNWFVVKRGRAIATAAVGNQVSNVLLVPLTVYILANYNWRLMFVIFAVVTWVVVLVPSAILMRRRPEDMGLHPDGIELGNEPPSTLDHANETTDEGLSRAREPVWTRKEAILTPAFWLISLSFAVSSLAFQGVNISLPSYMQDLEYGSAMVAGVITFRAVLMGLTLPAIGFLAEHAHKPWVRAFPFCLQASAAGLFLFAAEPMLLWLAAALYGIGFGGFQVMQEVIWANAFGRYTLGTVRSIGYLTTFGFGAAGPLFMMGAFDLLGSYRPAFALFIVLFLLAAALIWMLKPPTARRYAAPDDTRVAGSLVGH